MATMTDTYLLAAMGQPGARAPSRPDAAPLAGETAVGGPFGGCTTDGVATRSAAEAVVTAERLRWESPCWGCGSPDGHSAGCAFEELGVAP